MKIIIAARAVLAAALLAILAFSAAAAQQPTPSDDQVNAVARQLYCPVCENTPLDVCPTTACQEWRELIRQKLSQGWNDQQIKDYFSAQYGDRVLEVPPRSGLNWLVYVLPPLSILAGAGILFLALRRSRSKPAQAVDKPATLPIEEKPSGDEYLRRMEEELRRRE